jgi:Fe2+ or Zn2+ uptake regulation protein
LKQQRDTKQRRLVLDIVCTHSDHPSADQIYLDVRMADKKISRGTVYRNLKVLVRQGQILHVRLPTTDRYESRTDMHYHLLCVDCGAICDIPLLYNEKLDKQASLKTGYIIKRHRTIFEGVCPSCSTMKEQ